MQEKKLLIIFSVLFLMLSCFTRTNGPAFEPYHPAGIPALAVIGIGKDLTDEIWKDLRIGFGLRGMLTDGLYDTGLFRMVEEKQEIRERLGITENILWERPLTYSPEELGRISRSLRADVLAYATVASFKAPSSGMKIGLFSRKINHARVDVRVCLFETSTGKIYCSKGTGNAESVADSLLLQFQEDGQLSTMSLIGKASKKAICNALETLIPES